MTGVKLRKPHTWRYEDQVLADGTILRRPVLSEPERWAKENAEDAAEWAREHPDDDPELD